MASTALDREFDRIRDLEEAGSLHAKAGSRALRKLLNNRLAVVSSELNIVDFGWHDASVGCKHSRDVVRIANLGDTVNKELGRKD